MSREPPTRLRLSPSLPLQLLLLLLFFLSLSPSNPQGLEILQSGPSAPLVFDGSTVDSVFSAGPASSFVVNCSDPALPLITVKDNAVVTVSNLTLQTSTQSALILLQNNATLIMSNVLIAGPALTSLGVIQIQNTAAESVSLTWSSFSLSSRAGLATIRFMAGKASITLQDFSVTSSEPVILATPAAAGSLSVTALRGTITTSSSAFLRAQNVFGTFLLQNLSFLGSRANQLSFTTCSGTLALQNVIISNSVNASSIFTIATSTFTQVTFSSCEFSGNQELRNSTSYSMMAIATGNTIGQITISNSTFKQNSVALGSIFSYGANSALSIQNSSFLSNSMTQGSLNIQGASGGVTLTQTEFSNNRVVTSATTGTTFASSIYMATSVHTLTIIKGRFSSNTSPMGAAVNIISGAIDVRESTFIGNQAVGLLNVTTHGAVFYVTAAVTSIKITQSVFQSNWAAAYGGVLYAAGAVPIEISHSSFTGNVAGSWGGCFQMNTAVIKITNCSFIQSQANTGGTIYFQAAGTLEVHDCTFKDSTALLNYGGGIYFARTTVLINNTLFSGCSGNAGGAIYGGTSGNLTVRGSSFLNNYISTSSSTTNSGGYGGAISTSTPTSTAPTISLDIDSSYFYNNSAIYTNVDIPSLPEIGCGGAVGYRGSVSVRLTNSIFVANSATFTGGSLCFLPFKEKWYTLEIGGSTFTRNSAPIGAVGLFVRSTSFRIWNSTFTDNAASIKGGVIALIGSEIINLNISDSTFARNKATTEGGVLSVSGTSVVNLTMAVSSSLFEQNTAQKGGVFCLKDASGFSQISIQSSTFKNNSATNSDGGVMSSDGINLVTSIKTSSFELNSASLEGGALSLSRGSSSSSSSLVGQLGPNVTFASNSAPKGGAVLIKFIDSSNMIFDDLTFLDNVASQEGGAGLQLEDFTADLQITNSVFSGNRATGATGSGIGGGVSIQRAKGVTIHSSEFYGNEALSGAMISVKNADQLTISSLLASQNVGSSAGAISTDGVSQGVTLTDLQLVGNIGSLISIGAAQTADLSNLVISGNVQETLDLQGLSNPFISFTSSFQGEALAAGLSITGNRAPFGSIFSAEGSGSLLVQDTQFTSNGAAGFTVKGAMSVNVERCTFFNLTAGVHSIEEISLFAVSQQGSLHLNGCTVEESSFEALWNHNSGGSSTISETEFSGNSFTAAAFLATSGTTVVEDLSFTAAPFSSSRGPCLSLSTDGILLISNVSFFGCASQLYPGLINAAGSSEVVLTKVTVPSIAYSAGFAVKLQGSSELTITDSQISNVESSLFSVSGDGSQITLQTSSFQSAKATSAQGVFLHLEKGASATITEALFDSADSTCITVQDAEIEMTSSQISRCTSTREGGAIRFNGESFARFRNVTFDRLQALRGGAISFSELSAADLKFESCRFSSCNATTGGVLFVSVEEENLISFTGCSFTNSSAFGYGGVMSSTHTAQVNFEGCRFDKSSAAFGGIGYLDWSSKVTLTGCTIADSTCAQNGGAFMLDKNSLLQFSDSTMERGGSGGEGGLVYLNFQNNLSMTGCNVSGFSAENGGVISASSTNLAKISISGSSFSNNEAAELGGVISLKLASSDALSISSSAFISNSASVGGAIFIQNYDYPPSISDVSYEGNQAQSGPDFYSPPNSLVVSLSNVTHRSGDQLPQIDVRALDFFGQGYSGELYWPMQLFMTLVPLSNATSNAYLAGNIEVVVEGGVASFSTAENQIKLFGLPGKYLLKIGPSRSDALYKASHFSIFVNVTIKECNEANGEYIKDDLSCSSILCEGCLYERNAKCVAPGNCSCASASYGDSLVEGLYCELIKNSHDSIVLVFDVANFPVTVENRDEMISLLNAAYSQNTRSSENSTQSTLTVKYRDFYSSGERSFFKYGVMKDGVFVENPELNELADHALNYLNQTGHPVYSNPELAVEESPARYLTYSDPVVIAVLVLTVIMMAVTVGFGVIFVINVNTPIVKSTSPLFTFLMLVGILVSFSTFFSYVGLPSSSSCMTPVILFPIAFAIIFGNLFAKTFRIYLIFTNRTMRAVAPKNSVLLGYSGGMLIVELILIIIWLMLGPPEPKKAGPDESRYWTCESSHPIGMIITATLVAFNGAVLFFGVFLAVQTRKAFSAFRESQVIGFIVYSLAVAGGVILPIIYAVELDIVASFALRAFSILFLTSIILFLLFTPKLWVILFRKDQNTTEYINERNRSTSPHPMNMKKDTMMSTNSADGKVAFKSGWLLVKNRGPLARWTRMYAVQFGDYFGFYESDACVNEGGAPSHVSQWKAIRDGDTLRLFLGRQEFLIDGQNEDLDKWHSIFMKPNTNSKLSLGGHDEQSITLRSNNNSELNIAEK